MTTTTKKKKAVLLMAYGSPDREEDVEAYYTHIRHGRKPTTEELANLKSRYASIGGHSPLLAITESTARKLQGELHKETGVDLKVYAGMKHWHPFIAEVYERISLDDVTDLLSIALAPHYSKMSVGSYIDAVREANEKHGGGKIKQSFIESWHLSKAFLEAWTSRIEKGCAKNFPKTERSDVFFLFTAHSLPQRILSWNDPYRNELFRTARELSRRLNLKESQFGFAFQSAGHTSEPWLGPDVLEKLDELRSKHWMNVLVVPVGFVSDHLEILYDLDWEANDHARKIGLKLGRTESFNDSEDFVRVLASVVKDSGWLAD